VKKDATTVGAESTLDFTNGFLVTNPAGKIVIDGSGFVHTTGTESIAGDKTLSGNTTFTGHDWNRLEHQHRQRPYDRPGVELEHRQLDVLDRQRQRLLLRWRIELVLRREHVLEHR
jgi:hypothetical protein